MSGMDIIIMKLIFQIYVCVCNFLVDESLLHVYQYVYRTFDLSLYDWHGNILDAEFWKVNSEIVFMGI